MVKFSLVSRIALWIVRSFDPLILGAKVSYLNCVMDCALF